ncbi:MAG: hypothetical protein ABR527_03310 [Gemmatimonadota bacterium]
MRSLVRPHPGNGLEGAMLALRLTLLTVLLAAAEPGLTRVVILLLVLPALLFPSVLRTPAVWLGIAMVIAISIIHQWPLADNHIYLIVYWSLAVFLALCSRRPDEFLSVSARWLLAFVFLWATIWKVVLSPDYMDGRFFRVQLLTDTRFTPVTRMLGVSEEQLAENRAYLQPVPARRTVANPRLVETPALRLTGKFLTWSTILLEAAVAFAFLLPWGRFTERIRHGLLLTFCVVAYAIAPVAGFGWIIAAMGAAQGPEHRHRLRAAYAVVWFLILIYSEIRWGRLLFKLVA